LWNGDVLLVETRNNIHKTDIYEPDSFKPLALVQDGEVYYYHLDHLGTPQEMTDTQGEIVWSVRYKAHGNVVRQEIEQVENNLRFQGLPPISLARCFFFFTANTEYHRVPQTLYTSL